MAEKMSKDLKFQLEIAKRLYTKPVGAKGSAMAAEIIVEGVPFGNFSSIMVGWEDVLRHIDKEVITPAEIGNPYSLYADAGEKTFNFAGYEVGTIVGETDVSTNSRKKMVTKLAKDDGSVYVQSKYLEYFSDTDEIWIKDEFSPIFIFRPNTRRLMGIIMPFIMKK